MTQPRIDEFPSSPLNGAAFITALIAKLQSIAANRTGTARPVDILAGEWWLDTTTSGAWLLKFYDGSQDISVLKFDNVNHTYSFIGSAIPTGSAGGTVDAITCTFSPAVVLADEPTVIMTTAGANATTTPTLNANSLGAKTITRSGGNALRPGDIPGANAVCILKYNSSTTKWELLNPAVTVEPWVIAGGTVDALTATFAPAIAALYDGLCVSVRATGANTSTTPTLNVNGLGAKTIVKQGGQALAAGDIPRALYECRFVYNLANIRWELMNPATLPTNVVVTDSVQGSTATKYSVPLAITSSSNALAFDNATCQLATCALGENSTVGVPTNMVAGEAGELQVTPSGSYTLAFNSSGWAMADGSSISVTPVSGKTTRILWRCNGTKNVIYKVIQEA